MTEEPNYAQIAAAVYQACNHFDPYLPPLNADLARAWGRLFEKHRLSAQDLLAGVDRVYDEHGAGYRPLPKDLIAAARAHRRERDKRPTAEYQALCDSKAAPDEAPAVTAARRQAIVAFAGARATFGRITNNPQRIADIVARQRAAAPPAPMTEPGESTDG